ncbi:(2Fe-2S)-binding protein [Mycobacterium sp. MS1601]|nr:(2Fe-2S)-binding protein [Mycobacterium sp. MS1601]
MITRPRFLTGLGLGGAAAALAGCSTYSEQSEPSSTPPPAGAPAAPAALASTDEVPVGSGIIVDDVVLTQPVAGEFKGFSNVCTHTGCRLNEVADGTINCPCHGSKFNLDGTVAQGPASRPLDTAAIVVEGDSILAG